MSSQDEIYQFLVTNYTPEYLRYYLIMNGYIADALIDEFVYDLATQALLLNGFDLRAFDTNNLFSTLPSIPYNQ